MQQQHAELGEQEAEEIGAAVAQENQSGGKVPDEEAEYRADPR